MMAPSHSRRSISRLLIGVLVSTQMAIAGYACPGVSGKPMHAPGLPAVAAMAMGRPDVAEPAPSNRDIAVNPDTGMDNDCSRLDPALPNLCVAQHQYGQQSAEHGPALTVAPAWLVSLYTLPAAVESSVRARAGWSSAEAVPEAPHAVLHCCLRF
jgi:hypothetical protein